MYFDLFNLSNNNYFKNFYSPEFYIESFQNSKKIVTDAIFMEKDLNKAAHNFIDAQTAFAKVVVNNSVEAVKFFSNTTEKSPKTTKTKAE